MKRVKIITSMLVILALTSVITSGCSSKKSTASNGQDTQEKQKLTIEIMQGTGINPPSGDADIIRTQLEKALNVEIKMNSGTTGDDYKNQLNVRVAGGNAPDIFQVVNRQYLVDSAQKGLLLDLTPQLQKLSKMKALVGDEALTKCYVDGKLYAFSKAPNIPYNTLWVRKDWLNNLNLKVPTTLDELFEVMKAFTEKDPDGNGKKDTYGFTGDGIGTFSDIFGAFGIGSPGSVYVKDGKVINSLYEPAMKDALAYIKKIIEAGVVDPEIMANSGLKHQQKAIQGKVGSLNIDWPNMTKDQFADQIKQVNPKAEWIQLSPVKGPGGALTSSFDLGSGTMFALPKSIEKDSAKLSRVIELINYVSETDGLMLVQYGEKGKHYNLQGDKVIPTDLLAKDGGYFWIYQLAGRPEMDYLKVKFEKQIPYIEFAAKAERLNILNGLLDKPADYNPADADRYVNEEITKFIYGKRPLEQYGDFLKTLETQFKYKSFVETSEKQVKALGTK
jgi:putative aldouronate transport system substrate-binding protein